MVNDMDMTVEGLNLQVKAESTTAVKSVNDLIRAFERLDGVSLGNLQSQLSSMSGALQQFSGINAENLKSVSSGIRSLATSLTKLSGVGNPSSMISSIANIKVTNGEQLKNLSQSIRSLGYASSENAAKNLPILTKELKNLFTTLSQVPKVNSNVSSLLTTLTNFNNSMRNVTTTMKTASANTVSFSGILPTFNSNLNKTKHTVRGLAGQLGRFWATFYIFIRGFQQIGKAIDLSSQLTEVENVVNQTFGNMRSMLDDFTNDSIQKFGMSELAVKQYASRFQAMGVSLGITGDMLKNTTAILGEQEGQYGKLTDSMAAMSTNLTKLTADMASFYDVAQSEVAEDLYSVFTGQTRSLRQYGIDLTQANLKEWALTHGLEANMDTMTQAQKAALRYAYTLDAARYAMGDFARTADTWHNQVNILKANLQQLAILIGTGFINVLKPFVSAFNKAMASVLQAVTAVLNALGKIFGWKYEVNLGGLATDLEDAAGYADDTASGLGDAAKNAKKLKNQLMSFDKLNVITTPTDSKGSGSGSGGGGAAKTGNTDLISKVKVGESIFDSDINDFYELGKKIGENLRKMLQNIDWDKAFHSADNFGRDLANFLNGLITPETFAEIGSTVANTLNTVLHGLDSFGKTFNWENFGRSLAAGLNSFFLTFDWELLADTINVWAIGLLDAMIAALENVKWREIGNKIGEFLAEIDFKTILKKVGKAIWLAINGAFELYKGMFETAPLETALLTLVGITKLLKTNTIKNFITVLKSALKVADLFTISMANGMGVAASLTTAGFPKLGKAIDTAKIALFNFTANMKSGVGFFGSMEMAIESLRSKMTPLAKGLSGALGGLAEFGLVADGVKDLTKAINGGDNSLVMALGEIAGGVAIGAGALTLAFGVPAGVVAAAIIGVIGLIKGINDAFEEIETANYEKSVVDALTKPGGKDVEEMIEGTKKKIISVGDSFEAVSEKSNALETAKDNVNSVTQEIDKIQTSMEAGVISVEEGSQKLNEKFAELSETITQKLGAAVDVIIAGFGENSAIAKAYEATGIAVDQLKEDTVKAAADMETEADELVKQLAEVPYGTDEWYEIKDKLVDMGQGMDLTSTAAENLKTQVSSGLDWSRFIDSENGVAKFDDIKESLDTVWTAADDVSVAFEEDAKSMVNAMLEVGNGDGAQALRDGLPKALEEMNQSNAKEIQKTTDALQDDLINNISTIMSDAEEEWNNMSAWEKLFHPDGMDGFIKERVDAYKADYIDPLSSEIETNMEQLGVDGAGWASDAADEIINSLFDYDDRPDYAGTVTVLKSDYKSMFDEVKKSSVEDAKGTGKNIAEGVYEGMGQADPKKPSVSLKEGLFNALKTTFGIHSPATTMNPIGENIVLGIFEGFSLVDFSAKMNEWWSSNVEPWFTLEKWQTLGQNMVDGLSGKWEELKTWWSESGIALWWTEDVEPWFSLEKWEELVSSIGESLKTEWANASKKWQTDIKNWWDKSVSPWFTRKKWDDLFSNISKALTEALKVGANGGIGGLNALLSGAETAVNKIVSALNTIQVTIPDWVPDIGGRSFGLHLNPVSLGRINMLYENGGFPTIGSVFIAGEAGAEMVGKINGKTGVASGQEITGIREAIEGTSSREMDMMRKAITLLEGIYMKEFSVSADDVASATRNVADEYFNMTGRPYFAS